MLDEKNMDKLYDVLSDETKKLIKLVNERDHSIAGVRKLQEQRAAVGKICDAIGILVNIQRNK